MLNQFNVKEKALFILGIVIIFILGLFIGRESKRLPVQPIHTADDIFYVDYNSGQVTYEGSEDVDTIEDPEDFIEYITALNSVPLGYQEDFKWQLDEGNIYMRTIYNEDEQYSELFYKGPNWTKDALKDTTFRIGFFNTVEKIYDPKLKVSYYESYTIGDDDAPENN